MPTTPRGLRYPAGNAAVNVNGDIANLATDTDAALPADPGMSGEYTATTNGVPTATLVGLGASIVVRRQSGGLSATIGTDTLTVPAGLWHCSWVAAITGATSITGRAFAQIRGEDNLDTDRRPFCTVNEDLWLGANFAFSLAATTTLTFQFFLTMTATISLNHAVRLYRMGGV